MGKREDLSPVRVRHVLAGLVLAAAVCRVHAGTRHQTIFLISVDGLRADLVDRADAPTLARLGREGCRAVAARTVKPAVTMAAHASMLSGLLPAQHGIDFNREEPSRGFMKAESILGLAARSGLEVAAFVGKAKLLQLLPPTGLAHRQHAGFTARRVMDAALPWLGAHEPDLVFLHLPDPDTAGHASGWGSPEQLAAVAEVDRQVARLLDGLDRLGRLGRTSILLVADHGGVGKAHGNHLPPEFQIEWIAWGRGFRRAQRIEAPVSLLDTFPTLAAMLGLPPLPGLEGRPVAEAIDPVALAEMLGPGPGASG